MRTWLAVLIASTLMLTMPTSQTSVAEAKLVDFPKTSILYQSITHDSPLLNDIIVLPAQSFDEQEAAAMIGRIATLPRSILSKLNRNHITIKLFTGKLTDNPTARSLTGKKPRGYKTAITWDDVPGIGGGKVVLVKIGSSEKGKGHGSVNLELHELAHSLDNYVFMNISQTKAFEQAWEQEHNMLFPENSYFQYPEEYFAETFAMYYLNKDTNAQLQQKAPKTFEIIKNLK
ncbi:anthrax toxin lethal factor-related metalloendopeptidase [Bacillus rubiinfantis]|uniref:anthrax toxin lethal factor-related metalloendopeptidase n=1 Tax=Bacillus rubiinfantis TaxID=1499680 RepID=UPI0005A8C3B8|nr:hypothetical protein [Bacillus rubiinfantis]